MSDIELSLKGLSTDGSPHSQPDGAMREAKNVVSRRENTLEPRPGFKIAAGVGLDGSYSGRDQVVALQPMSNGGLFFVSEDGSGNHYAALLGAENLYYGAGVNMPDWENASYAFAESRGNTYTNLSDGVWAFDGSTNVMYPSGLVGLVAIMFQANTTTGSPVAIESGKYVGYRATLEEERGTTKLVSMPTGRVIVGTGAPSDPTLRIYLGAEVSAAQVLRLWRSKNASTWAVSDQMFEAARVELTSAHISAGYVDIADTVDDDDLGRSLYTNPEREGPARANHRPPQCQTMCEYQGSVLFGNITTPNRLALSAKMTTGDQNGTADSIGFRSFNGTRTNASADITGLSATTGLEVGQLISDATSWGGTDPVRITAIAGAGPYTLTMSETWGGSTDGAPVSLHYYDSIRIKTATEDQYYPISTDGGATARDSGPSQFIASIMGSALCRTAASTEIFAYTTNDQCAISLSGIPSFAVREGDSIVIEELYRGNAFEVFATHGDQYDPPVPTPDQDNGEDSVSDDWSDAIFVSKKQEPEHVPLGNFYRVGTLSSDLIRMVPTRDAVWCFKEDGLYSFSGYGERSGFRVDPVDLSLVLVSPRCAVELDGAVYAWTNRGVVRVSAGGLTDISSAFLEADLRAAQRAIGTNDTSTTGIFMSANTETHEVYLGITETSGADTADKIYCFNTKTGVWTTWEGGPMGSVACLTVSGSTMYMGDASGSFALYEERQADTAVDSSDSQSTLSGVVFGTPADGVSNITWTGSSPAYTPVVGDVVVDEDGEEGVIITVNSSTDVDVYSDYTLDSEGDELTAHIAFESCVAWTAKSARHPLFVKAFQELALGFESLRGVYQWDAKFESTTGAAESTESQTESTYDTTTDSSEPRRTFVSRNHSMCAQLLPKLCIRQGTSKWRLVASALKYTPVSERLHA